MNVPSGLKVKALACVGEMTPCAVSVSPTSGSVSLASTLAEPVVRVVTVPLGATMAVSPSAVGGVLLADCTVTVNCAVTGGRPDVPRWPL